MSKKSDEITLTIESRLEALNKVELLSEKVGRKMGFSDDQQDNLSIGVTEAVGNAIVHGNKKDPSKKVTIRFKMKKDSVTVFVTDEGTGFNPDGVSDPFDPDNLMKESGRGIFILRALMSKVEFTFSPKGTTIQFTMEKKDNPS